MPSPKPVPPDRWKLSVAPMMDWTDRHCRYFHRLLSRHALLYTEMVTTGALIHGDVARHLRYNVEEHPLALQLGGSEPAELANCAKLGEQWGYDEINLNCGCPSERVQRGAFGACLMAEPQLVADCVKAMVDVVSVPITVKHRIGIDKTESYDFVRDFVGTVSQAGCRTFTTSAAGDSLSGNGLSHSFGFSASGRRAWAWSPDGRFFAYVSSANGPDWTLNVIALQNYTRSNGSTVSKGQIAVGSSGVFAGSNAFQYWNNGNFGWAGSGAVIASGAYAGGSGTTVSVACPEAPSPGVWGNLFPNFPGQVDWAFLASPCGSVVAFAPKRLNASAPPQDFSLISTATAAPTPFRKNNVPTSISSTGANVSITTNTHTANGVTVNTGNGTTVTVDDPDCTLVGAGITVRVDRVKASTLPSANLGVLPIGVGVLGKLQVGKSAWVQVPNQNGWANQSEKHWCLLAQAYTVDGTTVARPWNGQASNPPPFPIGNENCAQRNIEINP